MEIFYTENVVLYIVPLGSGIEFCLFWIFLIIILLARDKFVLLVEYEESNNSWEIRFLNNSIVFKIRLS